MSIYRKVAALAAVDMRGYKRERARLVLDKYVALTPRNGRYTDRARQEREAFIQRFFSVTARTS